MGNSGSVSFDLPGVADGDLRADGDRRAAAATNDEGEDDLEDEDIPVLASVGVNRPLLRLAAFRSAAATRS